MVVSLADVLADQRVAMRPLISLAFTRLMTEVCIENKDQLVLRPGETSDDVVSQPPTPNPQPSTYHPHHHHHHHHPGDFCHPPCRPRGTIVSAVGEANREPQLI